MKHTALPWRIVEDVVCANSDGHTDNVAYCVPRDDSDRKVNAAFIVQACNAFPDYDDLITEALDLIPRMNESDPIVMSLAEWCRKARQVQAKAKG